MIVGIDLDNTIVCYDQHFHSEAVARGLISEHVSSCKDAIRDHLRNNGRESLWTELQGYVYGLGMRTAQPFPGIIEFLGKCHVHGIKTHIISHRTRVPYSGESYDLHVAASEWLEAQGFFESSRTGLS